jgi:transcriptional regulator with XRE-family HTH domain
MGTRARKLDKSVHSGGQSAFCELMVKARKAAGLTQRELADRLNVAKYEGGERRIDVVEFLTVRQAIGVDSAKLLKAVKKRDRYRQPKSLMACRPLNRLFSLLRRRRVLSHIPYS